MKVNSGKARGPGPRLSVLKPSQWNKLLPPTRVLGLVLQDAKITLTWEVAPEASNSESHSPSWYTSLQFRQKTNCKRTPRVRNIQLHSTFYLSGLSYGFYVKILFAKRNQLIFWWSGPLLVFCAHHWGNKHESCCPLPDGGGSDEGDLGRGAPGARTMTSFQAHLQCFFQVCFPNRIDWRGQWT